MANGEFKVLRVQNNVKICSGDRKQVVMDVDALFANVTGQRALRGLTGYTDHPHNAAYHVAMRTAWKVTMAVSGWLEEPRALEDSAIASCELIPSERRRTTPPYVN